MSGPKFRFTVVVGFLVTVWWAWSVVSAYLLNRQGLDLAHYLSNIPQLALAALAGLGLVWVAMRLAARAQRGKTGFEAEVQDEYGTLFKMGAAKEPFPMQLSKFLPEVIAPPQWPGLSPLEAELCGFLNGYRAWPADLETGDESLYARALARWEIMRGLPGAGAWHRVMALAADLGKIYAYREVRSSAPLRQFWRRDRTRFERRTREHGGLSAFMLSTLPGFRALALQGQSEVVAMRRALLTALRYMDDPRLLPTNTTPQTREILEYWQRCEAMLMAQRGQAATPSKEQQDELKQLIGHHLGDILTDLQPTAEAGDATDALMLPAQQMLVRTTALINTIGRNLPTVVRQRFHLWEGAGIHHPAWPLIITQLQAMKIWSEAQDLPPQPLEGRQYLLDETSFGPAILLTFTHVPEMQHLFATLEPWRGSWAVHTSEADVKHQLTQQAALFEERLRHAL